MGTEVSQMCCHELALHPTQLFIRFNSTRPTLAHVVLRRKTQVVACLANVKAAILLEEIHTTTMYRRINGEIMTDSLDGTQRLMGLDTALPYCLASLRTQVGYMQ